jgi:hypothetical protein
MFARYQINLKSISSGTTATTINIPISLESQEIGQSDLIDKVFVDVEVENSINPISDYDKVRYLPLDSNGKPLITIIYNLNLSGATDYKAIGFSDDDIKYGKSCFKESFIYFRFFDSPNPMTQRLISYNTIYSKLNDNDLLGADTITGIPGQPVPANEVKLQFIVKNPILKPKSFSEGYYLYDYRDELKIGDIKYLYMKASFKNAKTGKSTNLMVKNTAFPVNSLINELYTRFILTRDTTGYYYKFDDTYQGNSVSGPNNIIYSGNDIIVNLYQIQAT